MVGICMCCQWREVCPHVHVPFGRPVYLIDVSYFDLIFLKQVEGTRNDKVCRLLNTLVEIGTNAYQAFLNVLKTTGYEFLTNQIVQNEEMIRRENPFISTPIQETNQPAEEIRPSPIPFELRNYISAGQSSFVGSQIQNSNSSSLEHNNLQQNF